MRGSLVPRRIGPALPYVAVAVGLYVVRDALATVLAYQAAIVAATIGSRSQWPLFRGWGHPGTLAIGVAGAAVTGVAVYALWPYAELTGADTWSRLSDLGVRRSSFVPFVAYFVATTPLLEERYWRGSVGSLSLRPAWSDVLFAGYHVLVLRIFLTVPFIVIAAVGLVAASWLWRAMARRERGLAFAVVTHVFADAALFVGLYWRIA